MHNDYVYKDRKMMKWIPFHALLEQGDYINDLLKGREYKTMPSLSDDQLSELNYQLEEAFIFSKELILTYYENNDYKTIIGYLTKADKYTKTIYIDDVGINAQKIINIEFL